MNGNGSYLAFDLGAESGRAVLGRLRKTDGEGRLELEEIHRFPTEGITILGTRQWDVTRIHAEMLEALKKVAALEDAHLDGIGVDTWGVDFGLVTRDGALLGNPVHYRDRRTDGMMERTFEEVPREDIYRATGIQFMQLNTLYQLKSLVLAESPLLDVADSLLMMNDLFTYMLCGRRVCEYTNASTTQLLDPFTRTWHDELIGRLGLPRRLLLEPTPPGTVLGNLLPEVAAETGMPENTPVIASAGHDTACAVAAVPCTEGAEDWAYLSSGTWSIVGAELDAPHISDQSLESSFTNEGGVNGKIRFLKNIFGLWLVQECRRVWAREGEDLDYAQLTAEAEAAQPFQALVDVDDPSLLAPDDMPEAIRALSRRAGGREPATRGAVVRCALESLALAYRKTLRDLDRILGRTTRRLHVIGGGVQNRLLCQMTADACGVPVVAGPVEATALGNILVQALSTGALDSLAEGREMVARSMEIEAYSPHNAAAWDEAEARFQREGPMS